MSEPVAALRAFSKILTAECYHDMARKIIGFRRREPDLAWMIENRTCPRCDAKPGDLCRNDDGRVVWYHISRTGDEDHTEVPGEYDQR